MRVSFWLAAGLSAALLSASGCGVESGSLQSDSRSQAEGTRAERQLQQTLEAIGHRKPAFRKSVSVLAEGILLPGPQSAALNGDEEGELYGVLNDLQSVQKGVTIDSSRGQRVLIAEFQGESWTLYVEQGLRRRINELMDKKESAFKSVRDGVAQGIAEQMGLELQDSVESALEKLLQAVDSLDAGGRLRIRYAPGSDVPQEMVIENEMRFETESGPKQETVLTTYLFS